MESKIDYIAKRYTEDFSWINSVKKQGLTPVILGKNISGEICAENIGELVELIQPGERCLLTDDIEDMDMDMDFPDNKLTCGTGCKFNVDEIPNLQQRVLVSRLIKNNDFCPSFMCGGYYVWKLYGGFFRLISSSGLNDEILILNIFGAVYPNLLAGRLQRED